VTRAPWLFPVSTTFAAVLLAGACSNEPIFGSDDEENATSVTTTTQGVGGESASSTSAGGNGSLGGSGGSAGQAVDEGGFGGDGEGGSNADGGAGQGGGATGPGGGGAGMGGEGGGACFVGTSNCDADPDCEVDHATPESSCQFTEDVEAYCGDTSCGFQCPAQQWFVSDVRDGTASRWIHTTVNECSNCPASLDTRLTLDVPVGIDFDLKVYSACGVLVATSSNPEGVDEELVITKSDTPAQTDDYGLWVEVTYVSGASCTPWSLSFEGSNCL
jgi:hypothetical protein